MIGYVGTFLRFLTPAGKANCLQGADAVGVSVCAIHKIFWLLFFFACLQTGRLNGQVVTVTSPNGGENWTAGSAYNVTWTVSGDTSQINYQLVAYSTDNFATYVNVSSALTPGTRSFSWTVPSTLNSSTVKVRVRALDVNTVVLAQDPSDNNFTVSPAVAAPTVTVTSPNGGENWTAGSAYNVTWTVSGSASQISY